MVQKKVDFILDGTRGLEDDREQYNLHDCVLMVSCGGYCSKVADQEAGSKPVSIMRMVHYYFPTHPGILTLE